jgi:hypothetical protein
MRVLMKQFAMQFGGRKCKLGAKNANWGHISYKFWGQAIWGQKMQNGDISCIFGGTLQYRLTVIAYGATGTTHFFISALFSLIFVLRRNSLRQSLRHGQCRIIVEANEGQSLGPRGPGKNMVRGTLMFRGPQRPRGPPKEKLEISKRRVPPVIAPRSENR